MRTKMAKEVKFKFDINNCDFFYQTIKSDEKYINKNDFIRKLKNDNFIFNISSIVNSESKYLKVAIYDNKNLINIFNINISTKIFDYLFQNDIPNKNIEFKHIDKNNTIFEITIIIQEEKF